jgi:hypothetical protein
MRFSGCHRKEKLDSKRQNLKQHLQNSPDLLPRLRKNVQSSGTRQRGITMRVKMDMITTESNMEIVFTVTLDKPQMEGMMYWIEELTKSLAKKGIEAVRKEQSPEGESEQSPT